jgi:hypothetical protein
MPECPSTQRAHAHVGALPATPTASEGDLCRVIRAPTPIRYRGPRQRRWQLQLGRRSRPLCASRPRQLAPLFSATGSPSRGLASDDVLSTTRYTIGRRLIAESSIAANRDQRGTYHMAYVHLAPARLSPGSLSGSLDGTNCACDLAICSRMRSLPARNRSTA